jgi:L-ascorbate metabolism protein UlaG (beta-lactamase superfamily)
MRKAQTANGDLGRDSTQRGYGPSWARVYPAPTTFLLREPLKMSRAQRELSHLAVFPVDSPVYLKPTVTIEPLFCRWLAWSHLLSPAQAAMNITFRYLPLLQSFVSNPQVHVAATQDPKMYGGPFVQLTRDDVPQVKELIATTKRQFSRLLQLAQDIKTLDCTLQDSAKGFSLNDAYSSVPPSLAGMVELMYDLNNHPRIHLIEELLLAEYGGDLRKGMQEISLSAPKESERRFFMSTPRIKSADTLTITTEYSDPALDCLFSMRATPVYLRELEDKFRLTELVTRFGHLFTDLPPESAAPDYAGDEVRIRYFGHACVLIQTAQSTILIDPMFAYGAADEAADTLCDRLTSSDLPEKIDYVVLTHCHQDHFCAEMLLQIRPRIRKIVIPLNNRGSLSDPSMKLCLAQLGFYDVITLGYFDSISFSDGRVVSIPFPGEHSDLDIYSKQSIFVEVKGRRLLFLVDSDGWDSMLYQRIAQQILGPERHVDALFLGMECNGAPLTWLYGPLLSRPISRRDDDSRRLSGSNYERALRIIGQFECSRVYVYAMGQEPWLKHIMGLEYATDSIQLTESNKLVDHCRSEGMVCERLYGSRDLLI